MTCEEWRDAQNAINKWFSGKGGRPETFGAGVVAPPRPGELGDVDREELEGAALESWAENAGALTPYRAAARVLDGWRRKQRRRRGLGHVAVPVDDEGEAFDAAGDGASPEDPPPDTPARRGWREGPRKRGKSSSRN